MIRCGNAGGPLPPDDQAWVDWFGAWLTWRKTRDEQGPTAAGDEPVQPDGLLATTGQPPTGAHRP